MALTDTGEIVKHLKTLAQYEIDESFILGQAIESISDEMIRKQLLSFKEETEDNIHELSSLIQNFGDKPPSYGRDFKGFFMQGYTAVRGLGSDVGVLKALHTNEQLVLSAYDKALKLAFPEDIREDVTKFYETEKAHDKYINEQIEKLQ